MFGRLFWAALPLLGSTVGLALPGLPHVGNLTTYTNVTIYNTDVGRQPSYARTEELPNGDLLVTWGTFANYSLVYISKDSGKNWNPHGRIDSHIYNATFFQPAIYYLPEKIGEYDKGTILFSINAWSGNSTNIELYASRDGGKKFDYVSLVTSGGRANTTNGATPVWEPFLLAKLVSATIRREAR